MVVGKEALLWLSLRVRGVCVCVRRRALRVRAVWGEVGALEAGQWAGVSVEACRVVFRHGACGSSRSLCVRALAGCGGARR